MGDQQERRLADYHWFCGVFDGEGSIGISRHERDGRTQFFPQIKLVSSSPLIVGEVTRILTEYGIPHHVGSRDWRSHPSHFGSKRIWAISMNGMKRDRRFLDAFLEGLREKRPQALLVKEFIDRRLSRCCNQPYDKREIDIFLALRDLHGYRLTESSETLRRGLYDRGKIKSDLPTKAEDGGRNDRHGLQ
jgi:hypothetical protein